VIRGWTTPPGARLFKTGVINVNGTVNGVAAGEQPVFAIRPAFTLRTTRIITATYRNRWAQTFDVSLIKKTRIREGINAEFRAETFNFTNTPVFYGNPEFGPDLADFRSFAS